VQRLSARLKLYYQLTKPGIVYSNLLTGAAGFFLAAHGHVVWGTLIAFLAGTGLVIGSACVFNNYIDRNIDKVMPRTKKRALVTGEIKPNQALAYGAILGVVGFYLLVRFTNLTTVTAGAIALVDYLIAYGYSKRRSYWGTLVGSIAGALPPLAGYTAAKGHLDLGALLVFLVMTFWQMSHFYAIALYRGKDYGAANIPVLPLVKGARTTKLHILLYMIAFIAAVAALPFFGYVGYVYAFAMIIPCLGWLRLSLKGWSAPDDAKWGKRIFLFSLIVITVWPLALIADSFLFYRIG
jgi:protoheme IX farnesyltransferase